MQRSADFGFPLQHKIWIEFYKIEFNKVQILNSVFHQALRWVETTHFGAFGRQKFSFCREAREGSTCSIE